VADVVVWDRTTGLRRRVSVNSDGSQATGGDSTDGKISRDGRYVVYQSKATNLHSGASFTAPDIFQFDTVTGANFAHTNGPYDNTSPAISPDGQVIGWMFEQNLYGPFNQTRIAVYDKATGLTSVPPTEWDEGKYDGSSRL
jgi:Tol biopolymer transport system component